MINIKLTGRSVYMEGHAGSSEHGKDIVCAAASILLFSLAEALNQMEKGRIVEDTALRLDKGKADLSWQAVRGREKECNSAVRAICGGFRILEEHYPEFVKVQG